MAYEGSRISAIETEDLYRRLGVLSRGGRFCWLSVASSGSDGDTRSCHAGTPSYYAAGEHCEGGGRGEWVSMLWKQA